MVEDLGQQVLGGHLLGLGLEARHHPVTQHRHADRLDVLRHHVAAALQEGARPRSAGQGDRSARRSAVHQQRFELLQPDLARYERVREFRLVRKPFSAALGQLTPTLKLVRNKILDDYADLIEEIYEH